MIIESLPNPHSVEEAGGGLLLDRVSSALKACRIGAGVFVQALLCLSLLLLLSLLLGLRLSSLPGSSGDYPDGGASGGTPARVVVRNLTDDGSGCRAPRRPPEPLSLGSGRGRLRSTLLRQGHRVNTGLFLRPGVTISFVFFHLLFTLAFGRKDYQPLRMHNRHRQRK